jgi:poly(3-hydroxybutyrate) depolymerase
LFARLTLWISLVVVGCLPVAPAHAAAPDIPTGSGSFVFTDQRGDPSKAMTVYTYVPPGIDVSTAKIVFVMHGVNRDADTYRDAWIVAARAHGFIVVAPCFDARQWPGESYGYASVLNRDGSLRDASLWAFSVVEHLFDVVREALHDDVAHYALYGHSEGGQFVHRLVLLLPDARYDRAVAANAGWYTLPTRDVRYPYGLGGLPVDDASLRKSLGRALTVMLGDRDIDPAHPQLNRSRSAEAQGANRFERGHFFIEQAKTAASGLDVPLAWQLEEVPGAAHQNSRMLGPAAAVLAAP